MPILKCPEHGLIENVICCQGQCNTRYCPECFLAHNQQHPNGVLLNQISRDSLVQWNQFLYEKFSQIIATVKSRGVNNIYQMRLNPNYPKGLINELSIQDLVKVSTKVFQQYLQTLKSNNQFIVSRQSLDELDIPQLFKDIYISFIYDAGNGLHFLFEKSLSQAKLLFPQKKIYDYVQLVLIPKEQRILQAKRKSIVSKCQEQTILRKKKQKENNINRMGSPTQIRTKINELSSPKKSPLLLSQRLKSYNQNMSNTTNLANTTQSIKQQQKKNNVFENGSKQQEVRGIEFMSQEDKMKAEQFQKISLKQQIKNPNEFIDEQKVVQSTQQNKNIEINAQKRNEFDIGQLEEQVSDQPIKIEKSEQTSQISRKENNIQNQNYRESQQLNQLKQTVRKLQERLKFKEKSIRQLNNLISNEQQQIAYRQNEVQLLTEQIKKLVINKQRVQQLQQLLEKTRTQLSLKERSIVQLNKLIGNQQQQLQFRENQVETLTVEIKKLVQWKQKCQQIQVKLVERQKQLNQREKGIKQLNNLIGNQEQQLAFRQNQVQMLTTQLNKSKQSKIQLQKRIEQLIKQNNQLSRAKHQFQLNSQKKEKQQKLEQRRQEQYQQSFDDQLMQQVIQLESQIVSRNQDLRLLVQVLNRVQVYMPQQQRNKIINIFKGLKSVQLSV